MIYELQVEFNKYFIEINESKIKIGVKNKPRKGEANKEIIKRIAKELNISSTSVKIKKGEKSKSKIIEIQS